jgi:hypothetical protein
MHNVSHGGTKSVHERILHLSIRDALDGAYPLHRPISDSLRDLAHPHGMMVVPVAWKRKPQ